VFSPSLSDSILRHGFAHIPGYLSNRELTAAIASVERLNLERAPEVIGQVHQRLSSTRFSFGIAPYPIRFIGDRLRDEVVAPLLRLKAGNSDAWPSEVTVARYERGDGISKHRDHLCYQSVIALCSLVGTGAMEVLVDESSVELALSAGDLVLLGAPRISQRPAHSVCTLSRYRLSLGYRLCTADQVASRSDRAVAQ